MFRKILSLCLVVLALGLTSCENYFGDINENPNRPIDVSVDVILPVVQLEIAQIYGGDFSRFSAIATQQAEGVARQWSSINNYSGYTPAAFNTAWVNTYANIFNEATILKNKAIESELNHYEGVIDILIAYHLMNATDVWGDIPFSNTLQGIDNIGDNFPTFDSQESLYNTIFALLDNAIAKLSGDAGTIPLEPDNDLYYDIPDGGTYDDYVAIWVKVAHAIKARGYLHLGLVDNANYGRALASAAQAFTSANEDMTLDYPGGGTSAAGWYIFNRDRTGDIEFHPTYRDIMTNTGDADRLALLDQTFDPSHPFLVANYNQPLITFRELKFLEAEALMMSGGSDADIHAAWTAGVNAAFTFFGTGDPTAFLAANDPGVGNITMNDIMVQKAIALYGTLEPYNDWRRTGMPALTPNDGIAIPSRFMYGNDEITFNPNVPTLTRNDKVWWDQ